MIRSRHPRPWIVSGLALVLLGWMVPAMVHAQEVAGFNGFVQSGTCAAPSDAVRVELQGGGAHDVEPYHARGPAGPLLLGYYGAPEVPGFGLGTIYTEQQFSLVITDAGGGQPVACGDILRPVPAESREVGIAVVQLLPVEDSGVQGVASIQRTQVQRELDVIPTRMRILLSTDVTVAPGTEPAAGYNGYIQGGSCQAPTGNVRVELDSQADHDVSPYQAVSESGAPVTVAYAGAPGAPGFGLAAAYTGQDFSVAITDEAGAPVACGDILEPEEDRYTEAGLALVQLRPVGDAGAPGYALVERIGVQRELDITPTRLRIVIFAPPAGG